MRKQNGPALPSFSSSENLEHSYSITTRRKFKCKACHHQFSVTSGTIFASRKMEFTDLLAAICLFVSNAKGMSSIQFSRTLDVQYKTAWVMAHKLREALSREIDGATLDDEVEVDGAYFGGHIRPENKKEDRKDRRLKEHQTGKRRGTFLRVTLIRRGSTILSCIQRATASIRTGLKAISHVPVSREFKGYWQRSVA